MQVQCFVNYYDVLELNPDASAEAITHSFRHLARRYHPDNQATGDRCQFDAIVEAHDVLKDAATRAQYHEDNPHHLPPYWPQAEQESVADDIDHAANTKDR